MEPTTLTIEVTQELIDEGCHTADNCPVAQAVIKSLLEWVGYPEAEPGPIYDKEGRLLARWGVGVGLHTVHVYAWDYTTDNKGAWSPTPHGFESFHRDITDKWVERYDLAVSKSWEDEIKPITFELDITKDMRNIRDILRRFYDLSEIAHASAPSD